MAPHFFSHHDDPIIQGAVPCPFRVLSDGWLPVHARATCPGAMPLDLGICYYWPAHRRE